MKWKQGLYKGVDNPLIHSPLILAVFQWVSLRATVDTQNPA